MFEKGNGGAWERRGSGQAVKSEKAAIMDDGAPRDNLFAIPVAIRAHPRFTGRFRLSIVLVLVLVLDSPP
jgi:hypothetical protein